MLGRTLSHYRILRQLGAGGMGVVYEAEDTRLKRSVAVKFLSSQLAQDAPMLERFEREARAASSLNHPGICTVHAIEQEEGQSFIVMELVDGEPLSSRMAGQPMEIGQLLDFGIQIAETLEPHAGAADPRLGKRLSIAIRDIPYVERNVTRIAGEAYDARVAFATALVLVVLPSVPQHADVDERLQLGRRFADQLVQSRDVALARLFELRDIFRGSGCLQLPFH